MEIMKSRTLEVTVLSAEDLRIKGRPIRKNAFVTVRTDPNKPTDHSGSTTVDSDGGSYPSWNEKLELPLPHHVRFIAVEVQCRTGSGGSARSVGAASVPVSDIDGDYIPPHYLHFLSYRLRQRDGERNGIINLSMRVKGGGDKGSTSVVNPRSGGAHQPGCKLGSSGGVALGIPISVGFRM